MSIADLEQRTDALALAVASGNDAARAELAAFEQEIGRRQTAEQRSARAARAKAQQDADAATAQRQATRRAGYAQLQAAHQTVVANAARVEASAAALEAELDTFRASIDAKHMIATRLRIPSDLSRERRLLNFFLAETVGIGNDLPAYRELRNAFCRLPDGTLMPARVQVRDVPPFSEES
jgi:hypothetical protein